MSATADGFRPIGPADSIASIASANHTGPAVPSLSPRSADRFSPCPVEPVSGSSSGPLVVPNWASICSMNFRANASSSLRDGPVDGCSPRSAERFSPPAFPGCASVSVERWAAVSRIHAVRSGSHRDV